MAEDGGVDGGMGEGGGGRLADAAGPGRPPVTAAPGAWARPVRLGYPSFSMHKPAFSCIFRRLAARVLVAIVNMPKARESRLHRTFKEDASQITDKRLAHGREMLTRQNWEDSHTGPAPQSVILAALLGT